jgi:pimeloyl-ACP methyl ester carboxylesterase
MEFSLHALWDELEEIDVAEEIRSTNIPIYFIEGKFDMANPTVIVEDFYNRLEDKENIKLAIFEDSAHLPMIEERERYEEMLISIALTEVLEN